MEVKYNFKLTCIIYQNVQILCRFYVVYITFFNCLNLPSTYYTVLFAIETLRFMGNWIYWVLNASMLFAVQNLWDRYLLLGLVSVLLRIVLERNKYVDTRVLKDLVKD